jgi:hypothetical protein
MMDSRVVQADLADAYIRTGAFKNILVVVPRSTRRESMSRPKGEMSPCRSAMAQARS